MSHQDRDGTSEAKDAEERDSTINTIRQEMRTAGHEDAGHWLAQMTDEFMHGRPMRQHSATATV